MHSILKSQKHFLEYCLCSLAYTHVNVHENEWWYYCSKCNEENRHKRNIHFLEDIV